MEELIKNVIIGIALLLSYNAAIDQYAEWRLRCMQKIPLQLTSVSDYKDFKNDDDGGKNGCDDKKGRGASSSIGSEMCYSGLSSTSASTSNTPTSLTDPPPIMSVAELRRSVCWGSGIVENLRARRAWNAWLVAPPKSSSNDGSNDVELQPGDPPSKNSFHPGNYTFMYRSYVNFEEAGAIRMKWGHLRQLMGFTPAGRAVMTLHPDGERVTLEENARFRIFTPVWIRWNGVLCKSGRGGRGGGNERKWIEWKDTEMTLGKLYVKNPEASQRLSKDNWEIVKVEDDMVAFKRGDVGMLAYARHD